MKGLICFDVDNTLLHSDGPHAYAFNEAFVRSGLKKVNLIKLKKSLDGRKAEAIIKKFFPHLKKEEVADVEKIHHSLIKKYSYLARPISKNVVKVLKKVKESYDIGVVSNSSSETIKELLKKSGIDRKSTRLNSSHGYISYSLFSF